MRRLVWYLRSIFCTHEWTTVAQGKIEKAWPPSLRGDVIGTCVIKECRKCGWRWQQNVRL